MEDVLDLYAEPYDPRRQGQPLWADEYVLSVDEKTNIQARRRRHPSAKGSGAERLHSCPNLFIGSSLSARATLRSPIRSRDICPS
jgi:hypothetical protein